MIFKAIVTLQKKGPDKDEMVKFAMQAKRKSRT